MVMVDKHECVHLTFVPQNSQDFGFTGHLYVLKDSTYAVKRCLMNLPKEIGSQLCGESRHYSELRTTVERTMGANR